MALLVLAVVPMLVMIVPMSLLLGQMSLWYQSRPVRTGEQVVVTMQLAGDAKSPWPKVSLEPTPVAEVVAGPVRVAGDREMYWNLQARENGHHHLVFLVNGEHVEKDLVVGDGFMRTSAERPGWCWSDMLLQPGEPPFGPDSRCAGDPD